MKLLEFFRSKQWVINLRREDLMSYSTEKLNKQYTVYANHFEDNQFKNPAMKDRLIHNAVPTIFDIPNPPPKPMPKPQLPKYHPLCSKTPQPEQMQILPDIPEQASPKCK